MAGAPAEVQTDEQRATFEAVPLDSPSCPGHGREAVHILLAQGARV